MANTQPVVEIAGAIGTLLSVPVDLTSVVKATRVQRLERELGIEGTLDRAPLP